jgi:hypothetical protein
MISIGLDGKMLNTNHDTERAQRLDTLKTTWNIDGFVIDIILILFKLAWRMDGGDFVK